MTSAIDQDESSEDDDVHLPIKRKRKMIIESDSEDIKLFKPTINAPENGLITISDDEEDVKPFIPSKVIENVIVIDDE